MAVPTACPDIPPKVLDALSTWADPQAYDDQATKLAAIFAANFQTFTATVSEEARAAGPRSRRA